MRVAFDPQLRFGSTSVLDVRLNTACRGEIIPILAAFNTSTADLSCVITSSMPSLGMSMGPAGPIADAPA
jgi:hypothetical protein